MAAKIRSLLRRLAWWILTRWPNAVEDRAQAWQILQTRLPAEDEIDAALRAAFAECGLSGEAFAQEFDLLHSGKLHEVLHHASAKLGNPLVTVRDVKALLQ